MLNCVDSILGSNFTVHFSAVVSISASGMAHPAAAGRTDGAVVTSQQVGLTVSPLTIGYFDEQSGPLPVLYAGDTPDEVWGLTQINFQMLDSFSSEETAMTIYVVVGSASSEVVGLYIKP